MLRFFTLCVLLLCSGFDVFVFSTSSRLKCPAPTEENMPTTLDITSLLPVKKAARWKFYDSGLEDHALTAGVCMDPFCGCPSSGRPFLCHSPLNEELFIADYITTVGTKFKLDIIKTERPWMETRWEWRSAGTEIEYCFLNVYAFNTTPSCEAPYLHYTDTGDNPVPTARVRCSMSQVYPVPNFNFTVERLSPNVDELSATVVYEDVYPYGFPASYFIKNSIVEFPVLDVYPGTFRFKMVAFPGLTGLDHLNVSMNSSQIVLGIDAPSCSNPYLSDDNTQVVVDCVLTSPYPNVTCRFYENKNMGNNTEVGLAAERDEVRYNRAVCEQGTEGCTLTCSLWRQLSSVSAGTYGFQVRVSPVLDIASLPVTNSSSPTIVFSFPVVNFGDCPFDQSGNASYLDPSLTYTCQCVTVDEGNPPGLVYWYNSTGGQIVEGDEVIGDAILTLKSTGGNVPYECKGVSSMGPGDAITYTPRFADGPDNVTIFPSSIPPFGLCSSDPTAELSVSCDVYHLTVEGLPTAQISGVPGGPYNPILTTTLQEGVATRFTFQFRPTRDGIYTATCTTNDPVYPTLSKAADFTLNIVTPSDIPPAITSNQGQLQGSVLSIAEGRTVLITCRVSGGTPDVTSTTITCLGLRNTTDGTESSRSLEITRELHGDKCTCEAEHLSGCYTLTSELSFDVLYQAELTVYSVQGGESSVEVSQISTAVFECKAEGNPRPQISVKSERSEVTLTPDLEQAEGDYGMYFRATKVMDSCFDTDVYICKVNNGIVGSKVRSIQVFVRCNPLIQVSQQHKVVTTNRGSDISVTFDIAGYPSPSEVLMFREIRNSLETLPVPSNRYRFTVSPGEPVYSQLTLVMTDVDRQDVGIYSITMGNGVGDPVNANLTITLNLESSSALSAEAEAGTITGSIIGGIAFIAIVIIIFKYISYRRLHREAEDKVVDVQDRPMSLSGIRSQHSILGLGLAYQRDIYTNNQFSRSQIEDF